MVETIRGLTLTQPWATLMALGAKRIETRSWPTPYRGWIAIHAAKMYPKWARDLAAEEPFADYLLDVNLPLGEIVAVGRLVHCVPTEEVSRPRAILSDPGRHEEEFGDYSPGRYAWVFQNLNPVGDVSIGLGNPVRGMLGLWEIPRQILVALDVALADQHLNGAPVFSTPADVAALVAP